ncbi:MAG: sn-glycerol-3-phosphate ABC transporter permease UgpE [Spirochaetales bacterium]|nr:sn-glycerol-3-phosphate ABC transporter permease UgpE [Spirochaetales bacterium]
MAVENKGGILLLHVLCIIGVALILFPMYFVFVASTHNVQAIMQKPMPLIPGTQFIVNYARAIASGSRMAGAFSASGASMLKNSAIMAVGITLGKVVIAFLAAYALVYFRFRGSTLFFWMVIITLMLPVEIRILPTYKIMADLKLLDTYAGLILPLIASATATFFYRQSFLSIPDELTEAAMIDGAGPLRFMVFILAPVTRTTTAALVVVQFIYGWNQYLWPLLMASTPDLHTILVGLKAMIAAEEQLPEWNIIMATTILAALPPVAVIVLMQEQFIEGMTEKEK